MPLILDRDDRMCIYTAGGFTGDVIGIPVDMTLENITDDDFTRVKKIVHLLTAQKEELTDLEFNELSQHNHIVGDFGHSIEVGNHDDKTDQLMTIFHGNFQPTPLVVIELEKILKRNAKLEDLTLKP